jgi:zinc-finger of transposase IS204/IS1001/IS1096/IS1165
LTSENDVFGKDTVRLDEDNNPMLALVTTDEQARCCPDCGVRSTDPHSWVTTSPRDLPVAGRRTERAGRTPLGTPGACCCGSRRASC